MDVVKYRFSSNDTEMLKCDVSTQLDPQTLQGKDWQRTVIPMNGVSRSLLYFFWNTFSVLLS